MSLLATETPIAASHYIHLFLIDLVFYRIYFFVNYSTWNMDDFKRCYSNEDEAKSIPYFWEKFDPENYSIWFAEYKYPEELAKVFMSCNLITGETI